MLRALTIVWIFILAAFIGLAIRASTGNVLPLDLSLARAVQDLPSPASLMFKTTNWLGDGIPLATVTLGAAAVLQIRRCSGRAVLMLFTFIARLGDVIVKVIVSEPRPSSTSRARRDSTGQPELSVRTRCGHHIGLWTAGPVPSRHATLETRHDRSSGDCAFFHRGGRTGKNQRRGPLAQRCSRRISLRSALPHTRGDRDETPKA